MEAWRVKRHPARLLKMLFPERGAQRRLRKRHRAARTLCVGQKRAMDLRFDIRAELINLCCLQAQARETHEQAVWYTRDNPIYVSQYYQVRYN